MSLFRRLSMTVPIIQAPMAGVSTPQLAAAVFNAGALGSLGLGAASARDARRMMQDVRALTSRPSNVNVFMHQRPEPNAVRETAWLDALAPEFWRFEAEPPPRLQAVYRSFAEDDDMRAMLVSEAAPVVSFHFGLPDAETAAALNTVGCVLLASATSLTEALACREAGMDAVVAQGWKAGGHRGMFDSSGGRRPARCRGADPALGGALRAAGDRSWRVLSVQRQLVSAEAQLSRPRLGLGRQGPPLGQCG